LFSQGDHQIWGVKKHVDIPPRQTSTTSVTGNTARAAEQAEQDLPSLARSCTGVDNISSLSASGGIVVSLNRFPRPPPATPGAIACW